MVVDADGGECQETHLVEVDDVDGLSIIQDECLCMANWIPHVVQQWHGVRTIVADLVPADMSPGNDGPIQADQLPPSEAGTARPSIQNLVETCAIGLEADCR